MTTSSTGQPDLVQMLVNIGQVLPAIMTFLQGLSLLMGLIIVIHALITLAHLNSHNGHKHFASRRHHSGWGAVFQLFIGGAFALMGQGMFMVNVATSVLMGGQPNETVQQLSAYVAPTSGSAIGIGQTVLVGVMQIVGFIAILKSFDILKKISDCTTQDTGRTAAWFFILGAAAYNVTWVGQVVQNTFGYNIFAMMGLSS